MSNDAMTPIHSTPTSYHSADLSDIILSDTPRTRTVFRPVHVDNPHDPSRQLKGAIVLQKPKQENGEIRLTRRDIHAGEYVELSLDTDETFNLAQGLSQYCQLTANRMTAVNDVDYVRRISNDAIVSAIRERPEIIDLLTQSDFDVLGVAMRVKELQNIRDKIAQNIENGEERYWQTLFTEHPWVLSQVFALPYMLFQEQAYVGGKNVNGRHGNFPDFLYQNGITGNVAIIEIKTPCTTLVSNAEYRDRVYSVSSDVSGAVAQLLNQKDSLYKQYTNLMYEADEEERFEALNFESVLIVGNVSMLDVHKKRSFEMYRNELRNLRIIGFDELLSKLETMIHLMNEAN